MTFGAVGQMIAAPLAANIFVSTGSFTPFLVVAVVAAAVSTVFIVIATGKNSMAKIHGAAAKN